MFFPSPRPEIFCLLQSLDAAPGIADGSAPPGLLAPQERARCSELRVLKRRRDWLLGRWTAKRLAADWLASRGDAPPLDEILILADPDGAPYISVDGQRQALSLSISHSGELAFCALAAAPGLAVGADVESIEPRPLSLAEQFFTDEELAAVQARPAGERDLLITLVWSAKEAYLKCIREGLRVDTRALTVRVPEASPGAGEWRLVTVTARAELLRGVREYRCWWRREGPSVLTLGALQR